MHITILTVGSRGDVQPYIALGLGLQAAGHEVRLVTHSIFEEFVSSWGLDFAPLSGNPQEFMQYIKEQLSRKSAQSEHFHSRILDLYARMLYPFVEELLADAWHGCQGTEAIIYTPLAAMAGYHIAEKLRIPCYASRLQPRGSYVNTPLGPLLSDERYWGGIYTSLVNLWRMETLNLPPIGVTTRDTGLREQQVHVLDCYSPAVVPKPPHWPDWLHLTGYLFLDSPPDWQPAVDLVDFLSAGSPPVYIGFGSIFSLDPEALTELVLESLACTGQRGILAIGWGGLSNAHLPDEVFQIESVPHDWLFPQTVAVVHHGGAGTTAAGLRAGVPSIIVPFFGDQSLWGQRIAELGVGPPPIPQQQLTVERLTAAIRIATSDTTMQAHAVTMGQQIREEDGVARAVEAFHFHLPTV